ncbi:F-box/FBD/LRR-repeat protein At5g22660 [Linum perenne]
MEERTTGSQTQGEDLEDRISALPDEFIHDIMDRLPTANSAAKLIFLSKRWNHLWLSHPIVKFDGIEFLRWFNDDSFYESAVKEFANAVLRKLSQREAYTTAVRITVSWRRWNSKLCSRFLDDILDRLAAKKGELQISSIPNLKVLHIENTEGHQLITVDELRKLIPEFPSVESITLEYFPPMKKLQIFSSDKV